MTAGHRVAASAEQSAGGDETREGSAALPKTYLALNNPLRSGQVVEVCADYLRGLPHSGAFLLAICRYSSSFGSRICAISSGV